MGPGALHFESTIGLQNFESGISRMQRGIKDVTSTAQKEANVMDSTFKNLGLAIGSYFTAQSLLGFTNQLINTRGEFQKTEIAFSTMLGSADKAKQLMAQMVDLAATTPFDLQEVSSGAKQLLAFQVPANEVVDTLTRMGNIAAGLSIPLSRINLVYGQVRAKGKLMGDDLRQFTEAGIPMIAELSKKLNVAEKDIMGMVSAGEISFNDVKDVLFDLTNQGGMFFNLMEKQSASLSGQVSNLGDAFDQMLNSLGSSSEGILYGGIAQLTDLVENYEKILSLIQAMVVAYGAYKASIMVTSAAQAFANKTIASEVGLLGFSTRMKLGRAMVTQKQTAATLAEVKSEQAAAQAKYLTLQAETSSLSVKKQKLVSLAAEKSAMAQTAAVQLSLAKAELRSLGTNTSARQMAIAAKNVEKTQNQVLILQEQAAIARKNALTASTKFYTSQKNLENASTAVGNTAKKVEVAQEAASVAAKNLNSIATAKLTIAQKLQVFALNSAAKATQFLNATLLANPYAVVAALVASLGYAIYKYATAVTTAEESQKRMHEDMVSMIPTITEQESKIKSLISVVQAQNSTDEQRKSAIKQIHSLTNGRLAQLDLEAIKTGKAADMVKTYIETLKLEAEAKKYVNELGRLDSDIEDLKGTKDKFGLSDLWDDFTDFDSKFHWNLKDRKDERVKRIIKEKEDEKKQVQSKLNGLAKKGIKITETPVEIDSSGSSGSSGGGKGTEAWYKEEIQRLESLKERAIVGSKAWNSYRAQIEKYNKLLNPQKAKNPTSGNNNQIAEILPKGSIKELQQRAQLINEAIEYAVDGQVKLRKLDKYGKDKDKNGNPFLTGEIISSKEAYARIDQINKQIKDLQRKSFDEELAELERQWAIKNQIAESEGKEYAEKAFPNLKGSYLEDIKNKFKEFDTIVKSGGTLTDEQLNQWVKLKGILDELGGESSRSEKVKKKMDSIKESADSIYDYLQTLKDEQDKLVNDNSFEGLKIKNFLKEEEEAVVREIQSNYTSFIKDHQSFEEQKALITRKYAELRRQIMEDEALSPEKKSNALNAANEAEGQEVSSAFLEGMRKNPEWAKAFEDMGNVTLEKLKRLREILSRELKNLIESGKGTPTELKALSDIIKEIDSNVLTRNPFKALADAVRQLGNDADNTKTKIEKIKDVAKSVSSSADLINEGISSGVGILEDLGVQFSEETKGIISDVQTTITGVSDLASGIASMNPGQIIKGIAGVVKGLSGLFNGDRKKEKNIKSWAKEVENLKNQYESLKRSVQNALGEDTYKNQQSLVRNLRQQQATLRRMAEEEANKKKADGGKIKEWQNQIAAIDAEIEDIFQNISQQISGTNAKDMASTLADALIDAYSKGEDAATAYGKVANDVMANAVKNALKMQLLEGPMQNIIKQLVKNMGFDEEGGGSFDGLTEAERDQIRNMMQTASNNYMQALEAYSDLFGDAANIQNKSLEGAVKGVSEETASIIAGQLNAIRNNQGQNILIAQDSLTVFKSSYMQLVQIEYNTRYLKSIYTILTSQDKDVVRASGITIP